MTVTVNPRATIANKTATICSGAAFSITPVNGGAEIVPGGTTYTWTAPVLAPAASITGGSAQGTGQASISQTLTNTTNAVATATYTVTPMSGTCAGATFTVTVTVIREQQLQIKLPLSAAERLSLLHRSMAGQR
ncbi:MAG: hypothetical protein IPJ37_05830 [Bacteroidales bacterium]|nr:hypothetical protein [Bacteroidales bacterium]